MPTVRKVHNADAETWDLDLAPFVLETLHDRIASDDRKGRTDTIYCVCTTTPAPQAASTPSEPRSRDWAPSYG